MRINIMKYRGFEIEIRRGQDSEYGLLADGWYWAVAEEAFVGPCSTRAIATEAAKRDIDQAAACDRADRAYADGIDRVCGYLD